MYAKLTHSYFLSNQLVGWVLFQLFLNTLSSTCDSIPQLLQEWPYYVYGSASGIDPLIVIYIITL